MNLIRHSSFVIRHSTLALLILLALPSTLHAADAPQPKPTRTLYVDPTGNDQSPGTQLTPFRTLQQAANQAKPGDLILVAKGQYAGFIMGWDDPQGGTADAPITFKAEPDTLIISRNGKTADGINLEAAGYIILDGFTINNANGSITRAGIRSVKNDHVIIRNNTLDNCGNWGIFTSHSEHVTIENNTASHAKNQHGIYVSNSADDPVIRGNRVFANHVCGIHINSDASEGGDGIISRALVENNILYDNGASGGSAINCDGVQDSRIQNNLLYNNHSNGISLYKIDGAAGANHNLIVNNTIIMAANARWAINIKNNSIGNTLYNNILLNLNPAHGSINIAADSLDGFSSDYNALNDRLSPDDDAVITFSRWQSLTRQDTHSFVTTPEKLFVNVKANDYRPFDASPAIDAGTSLPAPNIAPDKDLEGNPRPVNNKWDLGAYEPAQPLKAAAIPFSPGRMGRAAFPLGFLLLAILGISTGLWLLGQRGLNRWIIPYLLHSRRRGMPPAGKPIHVLLCIADHFELHNGGVSDDRALARLDNWLEQYPALFNNFRDADDRPPRHTFFYPVEQYTPQHVEGIASLCRAGFGEIEIHLHHDHDSSDNLERTLIHAKRLLFERHGQLSTRRDTGEIVYGFVHGDWALSNPHPDGHACGVDNELHLLRQTGCYADFTFPSSPSPTQPHIINSIYYTDTSRHQPRAYEQGTPIGAPLPNKPLLLIQGPLLLNWHSRKAGLLPRIENACIQFNQPPTMQRLDLWLKARVQVPSRPDWYFVKLHTHGGPEANQAVLLGDPMVKFHKALKDRAARDPHFHYHYVTAREMYNLAKAAESGWTGSVNDARDFELSAQPLFNESRN